MADFNAKYTDANLAPGASIYEYSHFAAILATLESVDNGAVKDVASAVLVCLLARCV